MSLEFPACKVSTIYQIEMAERRNCIGKKLYDALLEDLQDYSDAPAYQTGTTYAIDDVVEYKGIYYVAKASTNKTPSVKSDWEYADKFETDVFNDLWVSNLGTYLSLLVYRETIPENSVTMSGSGLIRQKGENFDPASSNDVKRLQMSVDAKIHTALLNLQDYLEEHRSDFEDYLDDSTIIKAEESTCSCSCNGTGYIENNTWQNGMIIVDGKVPCGCRCKSCSGRKEALRNLYDVA